MLQNRKKEQPKKLYNSTKYLRQRKTKELRPKQEKPEQKEVFIILNEKIIYVTATA